MVVKLVDTQRSERCTTCGVRVQVPPTAQRGSHFIFNDSLFSYANIRRNFPTQNGTSRQRPDAWTARSPDA